MGHTALLLFELGAVLLALGVLGRLAGRAGFSPIPLYLLAGLAFGSGGLLPLRAPESFFETGAEVGVVLLLLLLGIEYSADELVTSVRQQAPVGLWDLILNGLPGSLFALMLGWGPIGMLAMFGVTAISSSGIISKLLTDLQRLGNRETPVILSVLVLEDLAMAVYLPVLTAVVAASGPAGAARSVLIALAVLVIVLVVALRFGHNLTHVIATGSNEVMLLRVLGLALLVAGAAESVHVSAAVGAFLLGIALSGEVTEHLSGLLVPLRDIFAAVFFVFFGLTTDPGQLPAVLLPALLLAVIGVCTKVATGWLGGRRAGIGRAGRLRAGAALIPRGEFSIIIAGLAAGSVSPAFAPTVAAYVFVLAVLGPLTPRLVDSLTRRVAPGSTAAARQARPTGSRRSSARVASVSKMGATPDGP